MKDAQVLGTSRWYGRQDLITDLICRVRGRAELRILSRVLPEQLDEMEVRFPEMGTNGERAGLRGTIKSPF